MSTYISNNKLPLKKGKLIQHYLGPIFFGVASILLLIFSIYYQFFNTNYAHIHTNTEALIMPVLIGCFATGLCVLKYKRLSFRKLDLELNKSQFDEVLKRLVDHEFWQLERKATNSFQFIAGLERLSGERLITLVRKKDTILFNEIKNPETNSLSSLGVSFGLVNLDLKAFLYQANAVLNNEEYTKSPEFNDSQWNWKMILARLFLYPLCVFMIILGILAFNGGELLIEIPFFLIPVIYFTIDWVALAKAKK